MLIAEFDALPRADARQLAGVWAAIDWWVDAVVDARPYRSVDAAARHAEALAHRWAAADLDAALAHHPRIGQRPEGDGAQVRASRGEQAAVDGAATDTVRAIAAANAAYENRFGRVFLVRAAGRTAEDMLAEATRRLGNDDATETAEAIAQLREIALLRLRSQLLDHPES